MDHLYYYLLNKKYSVSETAETIFRLENNLDLPKEIKKDIKEYYETWIKENPNTLF